MNFQNITLTSETCTELIRSIRTATTSKPRGWRVRVILLASQGCSRVEIAQVAGFSLRSVTRWCNSFQEQKLAGLIDKQERWHTMLLPSNALSGVLEKVVQARVGQHCWSWRSTARVADMSPASVQHIWAATYVKPHLTRTFKLSNDTIREEKFWDVIGLYSDSPDKTSVICCDARIQVHALECTPLGLTLSIDNIRTQSHDYLQRCLISCIERQHRYQKWLERCKFFHMHFAQTSSSRMRVERFFRDIILYLCTGGVDSIHKLTGKNPCNL